MAAAAVALASSVLGGPGSRLLAALAALPAHLLPRLVPIGRQVRLGAAQAPPSKAAAVPHDPLVPSQAWGALRQHRVITYRLRIGGLYHLHRA